MIAFSWYGGKDRLAKRLAALLPLRRERPVLVEVFGGSAALTLSLTPPWPCEVVNDLDDGVVGFYRVLRDHRDELVRRLTLTPYSRAEWRECSATWAAERDPIERARRWYVVAMQSFSGAFGEGWSHSTTSPDGFAAHPWAVHVNALDAVAERLRRVQLECRPWADVLDAYDGPDTVFYLDPPYHPDARTRKAKRYRVDMVDPVEHDRMLARVKTLQGACFVSGYACDAYDQALSDWRRVAWDRPAFSRGNTRQIRQNPDNDAAARRRTEVLWISPNAQARQMGLGGVA